MTTNQKGVYPRVGGGTLYVSPIAAAVGGLSPRGRGNRMEGNGCPLYARSIPAWAGEPELEADSGTIIAVYPRVGGEPPMTNAPDCIITVYPRVGGGTSPCSSLLPPHWGLSPRGRGNPKRRQCHDYLSGSIPAWAGEP